MINLIEGDLLYSDDKYIVHQCNCVTKHAKYLAYNMFKKFPYSDIYSNRTTPDIPGDIIVKGNGVDKRYIIALLGQYYPGKVRFENSKIDSSKLRKDYFFSALKRILEIQDLESISFPWKIGCGAAGGDWNFYYDLLQKFSEATNAKVSIYRLPDIAKHKV